MSVQYRPLLIDEIRVLRLATPTKDASHIDLSWTLDYASLKASPSPEFVALSYEWGPTTAPTAAVDIDSQSVTVSKHLSNGLRYMVQAMFKDGGIMAIWVDAVCINQNDIHEKNVQVPRMREVYSRAKKVFCLLSPMDWNALSTPQSEVDIALELVEVLRQEVFNRTKEDKFYRALRRQPDLFSDEQWIALYIFLDNSYWKRLWIIQEIALAEGPVVILIGSHSILLKSVLNAAHVVQHGEHVMLGHMHRAMKARGKAVGDFTWNTIIQIEHVQYMLRSKKDEWYAAPVLLIEMAKYARCKDDRDRVFGVIGLIDPSQAANILVDYTKTIQDVYVGFANSVIERTKSLWLLKMASRPAFSTLPSWVPALAHRPILTVFDETDAPPSSLQALLNIVLPEPRASGGVLHVSGYCLDMVDGLTAASSNDTELIGPDTDINIVQRADARTTSTMSFDEIQLAFWKCLSGNSHKKGRASLCNDQLLSDHANGDIHAGLILRFFQRSREFRILGHELLNFIDHAPTQVEGDDEVEVTRLRKKLMQRISDLIQYRRLAVTTAKRLAHVPADTREGDVICALARSTMPCVLRRMGGVYTLVGECWMDCSGDMGVGVHAHQEYSIV